MTIRLFDTPVRCGFSFFLLLALFLTADRSGFSAMMLLCILIHEVGHLVGFALAGGEIRSVSLTGLGIHIQRGERPVSRSGEACIHLMGPVFSFATALPVLLLWGEQPVGAMFTAISGVLGIFHLLPIGNLDGGQPDAPRLGKLHPAGEYRLRLLFSLLCGIGPAVCLVGLPIPIRQPQHHPAAHLPLFGHRHCKGVSLTKEESPCASRLDRRMGFLNAARWILPGTPAELPEVIHPIGDAVKNAGQNKPNRHREKDGEQHLGPQGFSGHKPDRPKEPR